MSKMTLQVIASAENRASGPLKQVQSSLKQTGQSVKKAVDDLTRFNQVMFTTSAFVGFFGKAFRSLSTHVEEGARLDRLLDQYERVLGPSGELFKAISGFTDASIDKMEALRAGIALKSLGIAGSTSQVAELVARAGVAAKQAGLDSSVGIKHFTDFLKDSNISHLEHLNLLKSSDASFKLHMAVIGKYTGVMGSALSAQERLSIGMTLLRRATANNMHGFRDLLDVIQDAKQNFGFLMKEVGSVIGTALTPLLEKFIDITWQVRDVLRHLKQTDQGFLFLIKSVLGTTAAMTGLIATLGTTRLILKGLTALGFGFPSLALALGPVAVLFALVAGNVKTFDDNLKDSAIGRFGERLKVFGAVLRGVFELTSSFFEKDNFAKGVGKISSSLRQLLEKHGLMGFVTNLSKVAVVVTNFALKTGKVLGDFFDKVVNGFKFISEAMSKFFGGKTDLLPRWLLDSKVVDNLAKLAAIAGIGIGGMAMTGKGRGVLGKIPIIGKFLGGSGPKGTSSDPIYTRSADMGGLAGGMAGGIGGAFPGISSAIGTVIGAISAPTGIMGFIKLLGKATVYLTLFEVALGFLVGITEGIIENFATFRQAFGDMSFWVATKWGELMDMVSKPIQKFANAVVEIISWLWDKFTNLFSISREAGKSAVGAAAGGAQMLGQSAFESAVVSRVEQFRKRGQVDFAPGSAEGRHRFMQTAATELTEVGGEKNKRAAAAIAKGMREAMGVGSAGGADITQNEFLQVMAKALQVGVDSSLLTKHAAKTADTNNKMANEPKMEVAKQRGGC